MDEPGAQHANDLLDEKPVHFARFLCRELHFTQSRRRMTVRIDDHLHDQHAVEKAEWSWHSNAGSDEAMERIDLHVLPSRLLLLTSVIGALGHGASLATTSNLAAFLILRALLKAPLRHVLVHLGAANLITGANDEDRRF